ncbi:hypothetical protein GF322_02215 [Candidatus Dependentiae bacterium]|nr:hypothetical protein [Candidatus Dependentiae bacterium]
MFLILLFVFLISLFWGSFLNVVAYRSIHERSFFEPRSKCNFCNKTIPFYDNFPVISWFLLHGKCRFCQKYISILYPIIEILTAFILTSIFFKIFYFYGFFIFSINSIIYFISYIIFFSALIVATRTDLEALVIPQIFTLWLTPLGILLSHFDAIEISIYESVIGAAFGYSVLWLIAKIFTYFTQKEGLGVGDMELLAMIGAFLGPIGVWFCMLTGSFLGLITASIYIFATKKNTSTQIPFGPFLALGATIYFFFQDYFVCIFF